MCSVLAFELCKAPLPAVKGVGGDSWEDLSSQAVPQFLPWYPSASQSAFPLLFLCELFL